MSKSRRAFGSVRLIVDEIGNACLDILRNENVEKGDTALCHGMRDTRGRAHRGMKICSGSLGSGTIPGHG
jgi:hypothetical protein